MDRKVHLIEAQPQKPKFLNVVGYARISSGKDDMRHSFVAQIDYFQKLICNTPGLRYCGVYYDERIRVQRKNFPTFRRCLKNAVIMK